MVTNYLITVPIHQSMSEEIGGLLTDNAIFKNCIQDDIIMDQDSAFISVLMNYFSRHLIEKIKL